jgi:hypothetical protein
MSQPLEATMRHAKLHLHRAITVHRHQEAVGEYLLRQVVEAEVAQAEEVHHVLVHVN